MGGIVPTGRPGRRLLAAAGAVLLLAAVLLTAALLPASGARSGAPAAAPCAECRPADAASAVARDSGPDRDAALRGRLPEITVIRQKPARDQVVAGVEAAPAPRQPHCLAARTPPVALIRTALWRDPTGHWRPETPTGPPLFG